MLTKEKGLNAPRTEVLWRLSPVICAEARPPFSSSQSGFFVRAEPMRCIRRFQMLTPPRMTAITNTIVMRLILGESEMIATTATTIKVMTADASQSRPDMNIDAASSATPMRIAPTRNIWSYCMLLLSESRLLRSNRRARGGKVFKSDVFRNASTL